MQILQVIPITKSITTEVLTYFSVKDTALGSLVTVPLRKKEIKAIVVNNKAVIDMKAQLRGANYQIRNVLTIHEEQVFSPAFLKSAETIKNFYATTTGQVLKQVTPTFILKNIETLEYPMRKEYASSSRQLLLQRNYDERLTYYKTMIREHMFQKESLHIICPTIESCTSLFEVLKKNNNHVYLFHSGMTKKQSNETYTTINNLEHPSVLISTAGFVDTHQHRKKTIVIEQESSEYYRTVSSPYIDMRVFIQEYVHNLKLDLIWADTVLRPETYHLSMSHAGDIIEPLNKRIFKTGDIEIINQHSKKTKKQSDQERIKDLGESQKAFSSLSKKAITTIRKSIRERKKIFLFVHRKGLAPTIVCSDCGNVARSPESGLPYALYIKTHPKTRIKERIFICTMSGESIPAFDSCQFCKGYNLTQLGIGTERVYKEVQDLFPKTTTHIIDSAHVTSKKMMNEIVDEYTKKKSSVIIIGTQKALSVLPSIDQTIIVSLDSYFSRMSYNTHPEILTLITKLKEKSTQPLLLQSRNITESSLPILHNGLYPKYIEKELAERKTYEYPPYSTMCLIKRVVPKFAIKKEYQFLSESFNEYNPHIMTYPASKKTMVTLIMMLQLDNKTWSMKEQDQKLDMLLRRFDRNTVITFNPKDLV